MIDKTKLRIGVLACLDGECRLCPYVSTNYTCQKKKLIEDFLDVLNPQAKKVDDVTIYHELVFGVCPSCRTVLKQRLNPKYCGICGTELEWFDENK